LKQYNNFAMQMIIYALIGVIAVHRKSIRAAYKRHMEAEGGPKRRKRRWFRPQFSFPAPTPVPAPVLVPAPVSGSGIAENIHADTVEAADSPQIEQQPLSQ